MKVLCKCAFVSIAATVIQACGTSQPVRVLPEGKTAAIASIGGPVVGGKSPVGFAPSVLAGAMHGVTDNITVHGSLQLVTGAFAVVGADLGASTRVLRQDGAVPELTASLRALVFIDVLGPAAPRLYPDLSVTASWETGDRTLLYAGAHSTAQWTPGAFYLSPFTGIQFPIAENFALQTEFIWQAANTNTAVGIFEGASSIGGNGSFGVFIGGLLWL